MLDRITIVEQYAQTEDKMFMTIDQAVELSHELAIRISECGAQPELVVGIANGALLMAKVISDDLNIPLQTIKVKRKATIVKEWIVKLPVLLKMFSICYRLPLLNKPMVWLIDRCKTLDTEACNEERCPHIKKKNIIIVDDAIETGQTLAMVCQIFNHNEGNIITTAVISWSKKYDSNALYGVVPDIYIGRRIQHFPWSGNSPYLQDYLNWLAANDLKIE
ncbi:hypothetical protein MNBD_GAMMA16-1328 [hydrothermal vent metagenome]|uniref:Phosphoribosyltransferase domain-containing protein n=1 Tax=hydrothermal vent metagenome TaxID=652676 RepID=A0A3B0Z5G2_9ZZZZ